MNAFVIAAVLAVLSEDGDAEAEERRQRAAAIDVVRAPEKDKEVAQPPESLQRRPAYEETGESKMRDK